MRTVLVTGANRGLGAGFVHHYLERGCRVVAACRDPESAGDFHSYSASHGDALIPAKVDMAEAASIEQMVHTLPVKEIDIIINNAGICIDEGLGQWSASGFEDTLMANAIGPALLIQSALPLLKTGALIVNISSGMGSLELNINPENGLDAYAVSKAALNLLTRRLADKLRPRDIVVTAISPGWVRTEMGGEQAPVTVHDAVAAMTRVIENLSPNQNGHFLSHDGERIPW